MIVYLILAICLLLYLGMLLRAAWRFDEPRIIDYPTAADALELLIADIESARKDVLVICDECKLDSAMPESINRLLSLLIKKHQQGVEIALVIHDKPPAPLQIFLSRQYYWHYAAPVRSPFSACVIDGKESRVILAGVHRCIQQVPTLPPITRRKLLLVSHIFVRNHLR